MKKSLLALVAVAFTLSSVPAHAEREPVFRGWHGHDAVHHGGGGWVAPLLGGLIIGTVIAEEAHAAPPPPPPPPVGYYEYSDNPVWHRYPVTCSEWTFDHWNTMSKPKPVWVRYCQ